MSGLYGIFPMEEHIQNYDCHLTDTDVETGQPIRAYWGSLLTDVLLSHMEWLEKSGWRIGRVIDLLSERSYQSAIDWQRLYPMRSVMHRVFERAAGRDALANLGVFVRGIIQDPRRLTSLESDRFIDDPNFLTPDRIAFESRLDESPLQVTRE